MMESVADRLLCWKPAGHEVEELTQPGYLEQIKARMRDAQKFVFDQTASRALQKLILEHPRELIANIATLAIPPYPCCWIECHLCCDHWDEVVAERQSAFLIDDHAVHRVGVLEPNHNWTGDAFVGGWERYQLQTRWSRSEQDQFFAGLGRGGIKDWKDHVFGKRLTGASAWKGLSDEEYRRVLDQVRIHADRSPHEQLDRIAHLVSYGGAVVLVLACLVLLNTPHLATYIAVPASKHFSKGKLRLERAHTKIVVNVSPERAIRYIQEQYQKGDARRPLHPVRGHFVHDREARETQCVHSWVADDAAHWRCSRCGGRRWWRIDHERGSTEEGVSARDYVVTRRRGRLL